MYTLYHWDYENIGNLTLLDSFTTKENAIKNISVQLEHFLGNPVSLIEDQSVEQIRCDTTKADGLYVVKDEEKNCYNLYEKSTSVGIVFTSHYMTQKAIVGIATSHRSKKVNTSISPEQWGFVEQVNKLMEKSAGLSILPSQLDSNKLGTFKRNQYDDSDSEYSSDDYTYSDYDSDTVDSDSDIQNEVDIQ